MKKILVLLCLGVLTFSMAACGKKDDGFAESTENTTQQEGTESTESDATEPAGTEPAGSENADVTEGWSKEMTAVRQAIVDALGENYWPTAALTSEMLEGTYGITSDMYDDYMGEMPMISAHVDTLLLIKAKSDKVEEVEDALNAYRDKLVSDTMQYPMNLSKIQASRIERIGDYVCFVQLGGDVTDVSENGDEAAITFCQEQNELVIEVIRQNIDY